jgi:hypothetical protein
MKSNKRDSETKPAQGSQTTQPDDEVEAEISDMTPENQKHFDLKKDRSKDLKEARTSRSLQVRSIIEEMRDKIASSNNSQEEQPKVSGSAKTPAKKGSS